MGRGGSVYYRMLGIYIIAEPSVATQYSFLLNQTFTIFPGRCSQLVDVLKPCNCSLGRCHSHSGNKVTPTSIFKFVTFHMVAL